MAQGSTTPRTKVTGTNKAGITTDAVVNTDGSIQVTQDRILEMIFNLEALNAGIQEINVRENDKLGKPVLTIPVSNDQANYAPQNADSVAYEASHVVKNTSGVLHSVSGYNSKTSAQFIQVFNSATLLSDGTTPLITFIAQASDNFFMDFGEKGRYFPNGITICNSSTGPTKTIGSADCWFNVRYE